MLQTVKTLKGNSGCRVSLLNSKKGLFIRKTSRDISYNSRLISQFYKQAKFKDSVLKTPKIFESGYSEGFFYIDMEYVRGVSMNDYIVNHNPELCNKIISKILFTDQKCLFPPNELALKDKIQSISSKIKQSNPLLQECKKNLIRLYNADWPNLQLSFCHGDLTFENIIIKDNDIYLIDFLDSFIDDYLLDASKLVMDLIIGWSWRHSDKVPYVKNSIIFSNMHKMFNDQEIDMINKFVFLHLLRMYPYCDCEKAKLKIELGLEYSIKNFNFS